MLKDLARNLYAGARLCFMLPVSRGDFRTSLDQAFALLVFGSATILLIEFATADGAWFPPADRVGFYALAILAGMVGCFAVTRLLGVAEALTAIVVMLLAGAFWLVPVFGPVFALADLDLLTPDRPAGLVVAAVMVLWFLAIAVRAIYQITARGIIRPTIAASILVVFITLPKLMLTTPAAWLPAPAKLPPTWTQENLYYGQFGMMDRTISWLGADRPGIPDAYFIGFGADAREPVFVNEMRAVTRLFESRFGARDRSAVMINSRSTVRQAPLANAHNLGRLLAEVGKRMNPEEDILFLYLSAPALKAGRIAPHFEPLDLVPIHATDIRRMLDDAGIRYRVIILSTCSVDGFIDPLRGPNTLVIAASEEGQRARGCTGDAAYTDFGKAFFDEALRDSFSLSEAFERARTLLAERDATSLRAAAQPAIFVGEAIPERLDALATQLEAEHEVDAPPSAAAPPIPSSKTLKR